MDDEDEFGFDDPLDALPANALQQLERDAVRSTQQPTESSHHNTGNGRELEGYGLRTFRQPGQPPRLPSGFDLAEEEIIDLDALPQSMQQELGQWPQQHQRRQAEVTAPVFAHEPYHGVSQPVTNNMDMPNRLLELENERATLIQALEEANTAVQAKAGEALVVRQRFERLQRDYEQKLATTRELHANAMARQKAELDAIKRDREKLATNNRFLEHDLALEAGKARQALKPTKSSAEQTGSPASTPKRNKILPFRDGFDEGDIVMLSPSKSRDRSKQSTPRGGGGKRKRIYNDQSPIAPLPLPLISPKPPHSTATEERAQQVHANLVAAEKLAKQTGKLRLLRRVLNHRVYFDPNKDTTLEALAQYAFPSNPGKKLSTIFYNQIREPDFDRHPQGLAGFLSDILVQIWDQCLIEIYYSPINILVDTLQFILDCELHSFAQTLIPRVVPLAIRTCDIVAIPTAQASLQTPAKKVSPHALNKHHDPPATALAIDIDVSATLTLLHRLALACSGNVEASAKFWSNMKFDFVLLILMKGQPLEQISLMLELLRLSSLPTSFGALLAEGPGNEERQAKRERDLIERLTNLLFDKFRNKNLSLQNESPVSPQLGGTEGVYLQENLDGEDEQLLIAALNLRLTLLSVFQSLIATEHGTRILAQHKYAFGRLVRFLHLSVARLYDYSPSTHPLYVSCINTTTRIIYHLRTTHKDSLDVRDKLRQVHGGTHMWLIALSRLAFTEALVLEEGIDEETQDSAHALLDEYLSPEEGEALLQMLGTDSQEAGQGERADS